MQAGRVHPQHRSTSVFSFASQEDVVVGLRYMTPTLSLLCSCFTNHSVFLNYASMYNLNGMSKRRLWAFCLVFLLYVFAINEKKKANDN